MELTQKLAYLHACKYVYTIVAGVSNMCVKWNSIQLLRTISSSAHTHTHAHTHIVNASLSVVLTNIMQNNNQPLDESSNVAHSWVRAESGTEAY